jgi:hypothetical protein
MIKVAYALKIEKTNESADIYRNKTHADPHRQSRCSRSVSRILKYLSKSDLESSVKDSY